MYKTPSPWLNFYNKRTNPIARLFCFHYAGGAASIFRDWNTFLPQEIDIVGVQLPGRENRFSEPFYTRIEPLLSELATEISNYLDKPYVFFGHSMGALISYELIYELEKSGKNLPELFIPSARKAHHLPSIKSTTYDLPENELLERLQRNDNENASALDDKEIRDFLLPLIRADFELCDTYLYRNRPLLKCPIFALGGDTDPYIKIQDIISWGELTTNEFDYQIFQGGHFFINSVKTGLLATLNKQLLNILKVDSVL